MSVSELVRHPAGRKNVWGKYARVTNNPENGGCVNACSSHRENRRPPHIVHCTFTHTSGARRLSAASPTSVGASSFELRNKPFDNADAPRSHHALIAMVRPRASANAGGERESGGVAFADVPIVARAPRRR